MTSNVQDRYDCFVTQINNAADESIAMIKISKDPTFKFLPKSWWTPELSRSVAQRRLLKKTFRKNSTPDKLSRLTKYVTM